MEPEDPDEATGPGVSSASYASQATYADEMGRRLAELKARMEREEAKRTLDRQMEQE
jgi:hypothetical protein